MQAARGLVKTLLRPTAFTRGNISSAFLFRKQTPAAVGDGATYGHSGIISSSSRLSQVQVVLGVTPLRRGGWSAASMRKQRSAEQLLPDAVPRRFASKVTASKAGSLIRLFAPFCSRRCCCTFRVAGPILRLEAVFQGSTL